MRTDDSQAVHLVVTIDAAAVECDHCGESCPVYYALPVDFRGVYVEADYQGEWRAVPACKGCYEAHRIAGTRGLTLRLHMLTERSPSLAAKPRQRRALSIA